MVHLIPVVQNRRLVFSIASFLQRLATSADASSGYEDTWANDGWMTGKMIWLLVRAPNDWLPLNYDLPDVVEKLVVKWSWLECVMTALEELAKK